MDKLEGLGPDGPDGEEDRRGVPGVLEEALDSLAVIDRMEVGPVRLEPRRITAPYRVLGGMGEDVMELVYRFEEDVFVPDDLSSMNLAAMVSVQAALNYGLFCREMVFFGDFDNDDKRFIREMARNTAREIYVKKFLEPNAFLTGPASRFPAVKHDSYLKARISFEGETVKGNGLVSLAPVRKRYAVLSSGGKDSLLSFGLLKEIGVEVHPVFVNESGRHWFTALNAYRYFSSHIPHTARVWTNSDRLFNWMLRHFPFIRKDFTRLRSDEYPVRLWTVAVFLFAALPLLRKRGIGRLVVGDEYDTTRRVSFKGIPHYDGLYDQSRFFDNALTRYFHRKGWGISQFSILRPLSELLIQKILYERYPDLQTRQVSCHAAHKDGDRVYPCGRCEKCRRIVGILTAFGEDPARCGYSSVQIEHCLKRFDKEGIHTEAEGARHLRYLLQEKGITAVSSSGRVRPSPEVMKLRFDSERSPTDGIPVDLREALYRIYLGYSKGAVRRSGRVWIKFDPIGDPSLTGPYPFEATGGDAGRKTDAPWKSRPSYLLGELTWPEAKKRFREVDVALLPVGSIEQHGLHLPLDTDAFDAGYLARRVADACKDPKPIVLPLVSYGVSYHHDDFSGTISISPDILSRMVYEIGMAVARHGVTKLVVINGHGGNSPALHFAAQMINRDAHIFTCVDTGETSDTDIDALAETPNDVHAGEIETSTTLAVRPELVRLKARRKFIPRFSIRYLNFSSKRGVGWYARTSKISPSGVLGDPTKADPEKGRRMWDLMIGNLVEFVENLKGMSLDELYQRRY